jgi:hypothetical protein
MAWEWSIRVDRRCAIGLYGVEAEGELGVGEDWMDFLRERMSVSKRRRSPSNEVWIA